MEGDVIKRDPVYLRFRLGNPGKNSQGPFLCSGAQPGVFYQLSNILPGTVSAMGMLMKVIMLVFMRMIGIALIVCMMMIVMCMAMAVVFLMMGIIMDNVVGPVFQFYNGMNPGYTAPIFPDKFQLPPFKAEFGEFGPQYGRINPQVHQRSQDHIP
jgi:hypothetical protein